MSLSLLPHRDIQNNLREVIPIEKDCQNLFKNPKFVKKNTKPARIYQEG
jgi:hypothetical protein